HASDDRGQASRPGSSGSAAYQDGPGNRFDGGAKEKHRGKREASRGQEAASPRHAHAGRPPGRAADVKEKAPRRLVESCVTCSSGPPFGPEAFSGSALWKIKFLPMVYSSRLHGSNGSIYSD